MTQGARLPIPDLPPADPTNQTTLAEAMLDPRVYGVNVDRVEKLETHISYVFLAGPHVYKIKKAVDLGFLNFTTLDARHSYCLEELRLNRRLAPELYLDVVAITGSSTQPVLGGTDAPIEYAVKMRRFAQEDLLSRVLARGELTPQHIDRLAEKIAEFHASVGVATAMEAFGSFNAIRQPALENFSQIRKTLAGAVDLADIDALEQWTREECQALEPVFHARKVNGFVRECHGDLHLGNIALVNGEITIFDCLEFSDNLRWIDVMSEVAFLVMDLHDRGQAELGQRFLNRYLEITGDYEGLRVLRFYVVYRALVRAKVHCLRAHQAHLGTDERARLLDQYLGYVELARRQTREPQPCLLITHGLSGSGKTTGTQALLESISAVRIRSDIERKRLHALPELARTQSDIKQGLYAAEATARTYAQLRELARASVEAGYSVIVDATFLSYGQRQSFRQLADALAVPFRILHFDADAATLRTRIRKRQQQNSDASEADIAVLEHQLSAREPLQPDELALVVPFGIGAVLSGANLPWRKTR